MWRLYVCLLVAATFAAPLATAWSSSDHINSEPASICIHCYCNSKTVICDFAHNKTLSPIWNSMYSVPNTTTGMELQLTDGIRFQLHGGFFRENRVNRFVVKGPNVSNGNDQVEFLDNAFRGNTGGYPDIQILGASSVFVRSKAFSDGEIKLLVKNSDLLVLFPNAFVNMNMSCSLTNIRSLQINESAFHPSTDRTAKARVNLHVENSHIDQINRFDVSMNRIVFVNCTIGSVQSEAFDVTNINQLYFENCRIDKVEARAFTSKLLSEHVSITGNQIGTIDSKAIMGSGISKLTLRENTIDTIKEDAILVYSVDVYIERNRINHQGKNWLHVNNGELIAIEHNRFANFAPIRLESVNWKRSNCTFANNWLGNPQPGSLNFSNCEVRAISVDRVCNCDDGKNWLPTLTDHDLSAELYCQLGERVERCFNASRVHMRRYANEACGSNRSTLRCVDGTTMEWYKDGFYTKKEREEQQRGPTTWQCIVVGFLVCCVLVVILLLWLVVKCRRTQPRQDYCRIPPNDCHTLCQEMKPMPNTPTKRLIKKLVSGKLNKEQCCEISFTLSSKCNELPEKSNKVIARHMQEEHSRCEPQILVADDDARSLNDGYYASTLPSAPRDEQLSVQDHIYSLPLLPSQYALPSDIQDPTAMPVYSEPINSANADDMPPAYDEMPQYATPLPHHHHQHHLQQLPSTSAAAAAASRLPDVHCQQQQVVGNASIASYATPVWRQSPGATPISIATPIAPALPQRHVRDLRQDLEAMPQFHPNQLSSARNQNQLQSRFPTNPRRLLPANSNSNGNNNNSNPSMRSFECLDGADTMAAMELMDMRGAAALPPDSGSDHSGGSNETVKIDDIEYVDA